MRISEDLKIFEIFDSQISTGGNTGLAKMTVQYSADALVFNVEIFD
jgi:hypothetical protein